MNAYSQGPVGARRAGVGRRGFLQGALALGGVTALPGLLSACGSEESSTEDELQLAWIAPTTGRLASSYAPLYLGAQIAVDEINEAGGIMGRKIRPLKKDDEADATKEPLIARDLQRDKVHFLIGPTGSTQALASLAATTSLKLIQCAYATSADVADGTKYPYHYQTATNTTQQGEAAVRHLVEVQGVRKIGVFQENTAYGEEAMATTVRTAQELGAEVVSKQVFPIDAPDLGQYAKAIERSGAEGILAWIQNVPSVSMAINALVDLDYFPPLLGNSSVFLSSLADLVPPEALKNINAAYYKTLTWTDTEEPGERQQEYARKIGTHKEATAWAPNVAAAPFYDFLFILKHVIEDEKSFDPKRVKAALDSLSGYEGMLGVFNFTETDHAGLSQSDVVIASAESGQDPKAMGIFRKRIG